MTLRFNLYKDEEMPQNIPTPGIQSRKSVITLLWALIEPLLQASSSDKKPRRRKATAAATREHLLRRAMRTCICLQPTRQERSINVDSWKELPAVLGKTRFLDRIVPKRPEVLAINTKQFTEWKASWLIKFPSNTYPFQGFKGNGRWTALVGLPGFCLSASRSLLPHLCLQIWTNRLVHSCLSPAPISPSYLGVFFPL